MGNIKASEFFITGIRGYSLTSEEERFIKDNPLGGVILFKRNIESLEQVIELNSSIINANKDHTPFISVDQEGGRVARLKGLITDLPSMLSLEKDFTKDSRLAYRLASMMARELVALGFTIDFAPVCDVLSEEENTVIGDRAFSRQPKIVSALTAKFIKGMQESGIAACAKHFPGHGDTRVDSHLDLPTISADIKTIEHRELLPFVSAIDTNVAFMMTAHIVMKALDKELPATMSHKIIHELLRVKLGFNGVVISDDLDMKGVDAYYSLNNIIEKSFNASVDMFIVGDNWQKTMAAIDILQNKIDICDKTRALALSSQKRINYNRARYIGKPLAPTIDYAKKIIGSKIFSKIK